MTSPRLPLTVIGGYLGAGKTTLINRLLAEPHGLKLMVLVNDFGAINIDADLLDSAEEDTLNLTNGCVCCTIGGDLFMAIGDVLDRSPRPDHLIVEASGIADPAKIAQTAVAEPDLEYAGIVTVVDGQNFGPLYHDKQIGPQIRQQVACADFVAVTKTDRMTPTLAQQLALNSRATPVLVSDLGVLADGILRQLDPAGPRGAGRPHPSYAKWQYRGPATLSRDTLDTLLERRPEGMYRLKGFVRGAGADTGWLVQVVGQHVEVTPIQRPHETQLVAIGPATTLAPQACDRWWECQCGNR